MHRTRRTVLTDGTLMYVGGHSNEKKFNSII